jgi:hypothetical protein
VRDAVFFRGFPQEKKVGSSLEIRLQHEANPLVSALPAAGSYSTPAMAGFSSPDSVLNGVN